MSKVEAMKVAWPYSYSILIVHLAVTTFVFYRIVAPRLVKAGIYLAPSRAARDSISTYLLSSLLILALADMIGANYPFDVRLLPATYGWMRIVMTPVSVVANVSLFSYFNRDIEDFESRKIIGTLLYAEFWLFFIHIPFMIPYI